MLKNKALSVVAIILVISLVVFAILSPTITTTNNYNSASSFLNANNTINEHVLENSKTEYVDGDGATIIKDSLPKTLQDVKNVLATMDSDLVADLETLQVEKNKLTDEFADLEAVRENLKQITDSADKKGANTEQLVSQFNRALYAPLTSKESIKLDKELTSIDKELIDAEKTLYKYQIFDKK
jgi:putative cell wall-binding protein